MFTWICPQCGREVPPSYTECPDCAERAKNAPPAQQSAPPGQPQGGTPPQPPNYPQPPRQPEYTPPSPHYAPQQYPPQQPMQMAPQPQYYGPPPKRGMNLPVWLLTILFAFAIGGVVGAIYWFMQTNRAQTGSGPAPTAAVESPSAKPGGKTNPLQKYIEISGVRFVHDAKKKIQARFVLINHSEADISGLAGNVTVWGRTRKSEEDAEGTFTFTMNIGPFESKEMTVPLNTKLKFYELPDWQNVTADVQITAPGA